MIFLGETVHIISILFNLVTWDPSILSTNKLSAVCLSLIGFDRNLSWSLYTYFVAFEDSAPNFVAWLCFLLNLRSSLGRFPNFLLLLYLKTQNYITKTRSYELECVIMIVQVTKRVINYEIPLYRCLVSECSFHDLHFSYRIGISTAKKTVRAVRLNNWSIMRPERISRPIKEQ